MTNIILRQDLGNTEPRSANVVVKNSGLSNIELDNNFNNINNSLEINSGNIGTLFNEVSLVYSQANSAYSAANNVAPQIAPAYDTANLALSTAISSYNNSNTKFNSSGGIISGNVDVAGSVIIEGTLTVSGNVTTISANNLSIKDNMVYLNEGNGQNTNPDLGFAGGYNDGIYRHAGLFRDATDGIWKVFDQYVPEPDQSIWIDTSNNTFRIADFQANTVYFNEILTSSNKIVSNLNCQYINGLDSNYVISSYNQANTALSTAQYAYNQANTSYEIANTANINAANASYLSVGTVDVARLGSGTANSNTYLAGDNTWKPLSSSGGASVTISTDPPNSPSAGNLWWDSSEGEGVLRIYYNDGDSNQWVDANPSPSTIQIQQAIDQATNASAIANSILSVAQSAYGQANSSYNAANTANINAANASYLSIGTVNAARLGSGTANSNTYLAGDNSWKSLGASGATLSNDTSSNVTYYIGMSSTTTGAWLNAYVANSKLYFNPSTGTLSATIFNSLSDINYKQNIQTIDTGINIVNQLNPVSFFWIENNKPSYGFIAQEIQNVLPEIVSDNNGIKSMDYNSIIPFLVKSVQELSCELERNRLELQQIKQKYNLI